MDHVDLWDGAQAAAYDARNANMFADDRLGPAVEMLAKLAGSGSALELAAGTGRIALPLARRGVRVHAVGYSAPMMEQLRDKDEHGLVSTTVADMSTVELGGIVRVGVCGIQLPGESGHPRRASGVFSQRGKTPRARGPVCCGTLGAERAPTWQGPRPTLNPVP